MLQLKVKNLKSPKISAEQSNLSRGGLYSILNGCEVKRKTIKVFENENDSWNLILYTFFVERTGVAKLGVFGFEISIVMHYGYFKLGWIESRLVEIYKGLRENKYHSKENNLAIYEFTLYCWISLYLMIDVYVHFST